MLANKNKSHENIVFKSKSYEEQRAWFWFPLFSFFESNIDGKIPNEFDWPINMYDIKESLKSAQDCIIDVYEKFNNKITNNSSNETKIDQSASKKNGFKKKIKTKWRLLTYTISLPFLQQ